VSDESYDFRGCPLFISQNISPGLLSSSNPAVEMGVLNGISQGGERVMQISGGLPGFETSQDSGWELSGELPGGLIGKFGIKNQGSVIQRQIGLMMGQ
jgi:hypothetical protein